MNKATYTGRLTKDPEVRYTKDNLAVANFTIAVNRKYKRQGQPEADFIPCTAYGKIAEFIEKYFRKGMKIEVSGRTETGSYTNREGNKVFTWTTTVEEAEFGESKSSQEGNSAAKAPTSNYDATGFMNIPDGIDEELPFT
jgi:single-strand DNA-binding protein